MTAPLLIELGCEELPAGACRVADEHAAPALARLLEERRLAASAVSAFVSPRRIAVLASDVPSEQAAERVEHRGPPEAIARDDDGNLSRAAVGFARRHGLEPGELELRDGFAWAVVDAATATLEAVAQELVDGLVDGLQMPKNMRWGSWPLRFARPVRTLVVLHGERVLAAELAGVRSGRTIRGHRLVAPAVELADAGSYLAAAAAAGVVLPTLERRRQIVDGLDAAAAERGVTWSDPAGVLDEVQYLVERPRALAGGFDDRYLELPDRVLVTAMQSHQRYLPLARDGQRYPGFLTVSNANAADDATVRVGNERVLTGRLDDAAFALAQDQRVGLEAMAAGLERVTFHARAGSLADKTARIAALVERLAEAAGASPAETAAARAAARLAKADQASNLVQEFADLEGYVGEQYARAAQLDEAVARAIGEQFLPDRADGPLPQTAAGALVALADKLDTLTTALAIGERPTGSRDPYGLRRAAAGIVAIALARGLALDVDALARDLHVLLEAQGARLALSADETAAAVAGFVLDRADAVLEAEGVAYDLVRAARGADRRADPVEHVRRARALAAAADGEAFARALGAFRRAHRLAAKADGAERVPRAQLAEQAELDLHDALELATAGLAAACATGDDAAALAALAELAAPVDAFFGRLLVMDPDTDVRARRLGLLVDVVAATRGLADLAEVQR